MSETTREALHRHLLAARSHAVDVEAQAAIEHALDACAALPPTEIVQCDGCGRTGLPERIRDSPCPHVS